MWGSSSNCTYPWKTFTILLCALARARFHQGLISMLQGKCSWMLAKRSWSVICARGCAGRIVTRMKVWMLAWRHVSMMYIYSKVTIWTLLFTDMWMFTTIPCQNSDYIISRRAWQQLSGSLQTAENEKPVFFQKKLVFQHDLRFHRFWDL